MKYVVVALLLAVAAIAYPNIVAHRNLQAAKRTMADMRTLATAWEARATDLNHYLVKQRGSVAYDDLRRVLEPTYVKHLPRDDGWGDAFILWSTDQEYAVRSIGADRRIDPHTAPGAFTNFDCDIVYTNGTFTSYLESSCQN